MFPNGWPGKGLLLLRVVAGALLIREGIFGLSGGPAVGVVVRHVVEIGAGVLFLVGLWTPIAGVLVLVVQLWVIFAEPDRPPVAILLATLGSALAMLGPGAISIDALLYGRRRIDIRDR